MRSGSICATWPFDPRAAPSQALPPYKKIALSYRHVLPQPYAELQGPAPVQLNGHRSPLTPPLPAVQLNQGFFEVATLDRRYAHSALTTSKKPPDSKDLDLLRGAEREQQRSFRSQAPGATRRIFLCATPGSPLRIGRICIATALGLSRLEESASKLASPNRFVRLDRFAPSMEASNAVQNLVSARRYGIVGHLRSGERNERPAALT